MFFLKGAIFDKHGIQVCNFRKPIEIHKANKIIEDLILKDS